MTAITDYYGLNKGWQTYLEIYSKPVKGRSRQIHRQLVDQDAYDTWHLSFYLKEILTYKRLKSKKRIEFDEIPRKEKNLLVYLLIRAMNKQVTLCELGQSLFELIDGLEVVDTYLRSKKYSTYTVDLHACKYLGIDISDDLCLTSELLHPSYNIRTFTNVTETLPKFHLLYDRNVSSYAFTSAKHLAAFINKGDVALMNLFVSKKETFISKRLGKSLTYFSLSELIESLDKPLFHLFGEKSPGPFKGRELDMGKDVVEGFFLIADQKTAETFMNVSLAVPEVKNYFTAKNIQLRPARELLRV